MTFNQKYLEKPRAICPQFGKRFVKGRHHQHQLWKVSIISRNKFEVSNCLGATVPTYHQKLEILFSKKLEILPIDDLRAEFYILSDHHFELNKF